MLDFRMDTFLTVCRYMNFTRAAEELHITQPAVSQHIRWLESVYGVKLFAYQGKKMSLSPAGRLLLGAATTMKHDTLSLAQQLEELQKNRNSLRFGATLTIGAFTMPGPLSAYLKEHPDTFLHMSVANTAHLLEQLDQGDIDFALVEGFFTKNEYDSLVYSSEAYVAVCGSGYPFAHPPRVLSDLFSERLILREPGSGTREVLENHLALRNCALTDFKNRVELGDITAIKTLARQNCGVTFLYETSVREELDSGTLRKIDLLDFQVAHDFTFLWRKDSIFSASYRELFLRLREQAE